jgi:3-deoxy-D-manno-octulosonate 8-phosphate phosphatase (KDO 8-P phosphatase)
MVTATSFVALPGLADLRARAARVRLVLTDCDGVLTDGGVFVGAEGEIWKRFSVRDGMGVERLRRQGLATAIVTRERSPSVRRRSEKLGLPFFFEGVSDKADHLAVILAAAQVSVRDLAFIGDDVNDLGLISILSAQGLTGAPADAFPEVARAVHHCCRAAGGHGAFREFAEWILKLKEGI